VTASTRLRARRGEGDRLRAEIIDATEQLVTRSGGAEAVSVRAIAEAVGVSPPAIYLHFADKDELIRAVCDRTFAAFDTAIEEAGNSTADPVESLRRRASAYVRFGLERPEQYRILFMSPPTTAPLEPDMPGADAFQHLVDAVAHAIAAGALRPELDAFVVATGLWTSMHGITSAWISLPTFPWPVLDELVEHMCTTQLRGLAASRKDSS